MASTTDADPSRSTPHAQPLDARVNDVVQRIPTRSYTDDGVGAPFLFDGCPATIIAQCLPHCTGQHRTDAVYVLECLQNDAYELAQIRYLASVRTPWEGEIEDANRLIYVGRTVNLLRRLDEHLNSMGKRGADFTSVFRPVRVLDVSWWSAPDEAMRAERQIADGLDRRFPDDYVYQS